MKKVSLVIAIAAIMAGTSAMAADLEALKAKEAGATTTTATPAVESVPTFKALDVELVKGAVLTYIEKDVTLKGGEFLIYDALKGQKKVLRLKNPQIKDAPVAQDADTSVQSVEMVPVKGEKTVTTVDFQVKKGASGALDVASIVIRKVGKKERFIYDEKGQMAPVPKKSKKSRKS
jgi:flagellar basal body-associated protein FliL